MSTKASGGPCDENGEIVQGVVTGYSLPIPNSHESSISPSFVFKEYASILTDTSIVTSANQADTIYTDIANTELKPTVNFQQYAEIPAEPNTLESIHPLSTTSPLDKMPGKVAINVTKVTLQCGHKCWIQPNGANRKEKRSKKKFLLRFVGYVDHDDELKLITNMKAGDVWFVKDQQVNYFYYPDTTATYNSQWIGVQLFPTIKDGKILSCVIQILNNLRIAVGT